MTTQLKLCSISCMAKGIIDFEFKTNFCKILKQVQKVEDEFLASADLTHFHSHYLLDLYLTKQETMQEMSARLGCDKANTTRVVKDLIDKNLVTKTSQIRKFSLKLTDKGKMVALTLKRKITSFLKSVFSDFSVEEKQQFALLFEKMLCGLNRACKGSETC